MLTLPHLKTGEIEFFTGFFVQRPAFCLVVLCNSACKFPNLVNVFNGNNHNAIAIGHNQIARTNQNATNVYRNVTRVILKTSRSDSTTVYSEVDRNLFFDQFVTVSASSIGDNAHKSLEYMTTVSYTHLTLPTNREV